MELFITLFIVGFLKKNVCADSGFLELFINFLTVVAAMFTLTRLIAPFL